MTSSKAEDWGRLIVKGLAHYHEAKVDLMKQEIEQLPKGARPPVNWRAVEHEVDDKLEWALAKARQFDEDYRATANADEWAALIQQERADWGEATLALRGGATDDETIRQAFEALRQSMRKIQSRRSARP